MKEDRPVSYLIFITSLILTILVFISATILSYYQAPVKYAMMLAFIQIIVFALVSVGVFSSFRYKSESKEQKKYNRIGLVGNGIIFLFTLVLMIFATF